MAVFLDDIKSMKLYKTKCYLPINKESRKTGSLIFLVTKSLEQSTKLMTSPIFVNINSFMSYYLEKNVSLYLNENRVWTSAINDIINESLSKSERDAIQKNDFGLPEERKYPLDSEKHVKSVIKLFGHCEEDKKHFLASRIMKAAKKYNIEVSKTSEVYKYAHESAVIESIMNEEVIPDIIHEYSILEENTGIITEDYIRYNLDGKDTKIYFDEAVDAIIENNAIDAKLRKLLYFERIKTNKDQLLIYKKLHDLLPNIKFTYINLALYKQKNLFVDLSYYLGNFISKNKYKLDIGMNLLVEFLSRAFNDTRLTEHGYDKKTIFINVNDWIPSDQKLNIFDKHDINPISLIHYHLFKDTMDSLVSKIPYDIVFTDGNAYFKVNLTELAKPMLPKFKTLINKLISHETDDAEVIAKDSKDVIITKVIDKISNSRNIEINNITSTNNFVSGIPIRNIHKPSGPFNKINTTSEEKKAAIVQKIADLAGESNSEDEVIDKLDKDLGKEKFIMDIEDLESEEGDVPINKARVARMSKLNSELMSKNLNGRSIKQYLEDDKNKEVPTDKIPIDSINEDWNKVKFSKFSSSYNLDDDIVSIMTSLTDKSTPISILDIDKKDATTSEDYIETWTVKFEDINGRRFNVAIDVPKFIDGRFMKLRGNLKTVEGQLMLIPVIKTDQDTAQIVSNYNKIFIKRFNPAGGSKTSAAQSILTKILDRYEGKTFKVIIGNNELICKKYELPIEYQDLATSYSKIEFNDGSYISFNLDDMTEKAKNGKTDVYTDNKLFIYYDKRTNKYVQANSNSVSFDILNIIRAHAEKNNDSKLLELLDTTKPSPKLSYSIASILNTEIPVIVVMAYSEGLQTAMDKANIKYSFSETRPKNNPYIKFSDGYLEYDSNLSSSLLMMGLSKCDTSFYSIKDINSKEMWIDCLDNFGGRIKADGLDNFYDLMIDPITKEICELYKLPTDYVSILAYASTLLVDTKYNRHTDITGNRLRTNEIVAGYVYKAIANAYGDYKTQMKRNKKIASFTVKQSAVIDAILQDPTASDLSVLNPLLEAEANNALSFKGLSGMNSERSYSLDKRIYDESMLGVVGMSTGFSGNVGITRQATLNANITNARGVIKNTADKDLNTLNMLTVTEAMTPFQTTHDDPMRVAMGYIQTSKHQMRVKRSSPNLVTLGADEALPYLTSNIFSYKFKGNKGKVIDVTDRWIIVEDSETKERSFVDLEEKTMKNSDGGFYVTLKLDANVKKGKSIKYNDILAYDKTSYSKQVGNADGNGIAYNSGTLTKIAIMTSDEAFNDTTVITESLSDSMTSDYCVEKARYLPKDANIYNLVEKGSHIEEGEPLMVFQNAFDEKDANILVSSITDDELEAVSDLGRIHVRSKLTGVIQDIKIFRTCEINELSPSLKKLVTAYENRIKKEKAELKKQGIENVDGLLDPDYKLEPNGKLKDCVDGVKIFIYLKCRDSMGIGDKLVFSSALKGVIKTVIPQKDAPYTDYRPTEPCESILTTAGCNARMVTSILLNGSINKALLELDRQCKEALGLEWPDLSKIEPNF